MGKNIKIFQSPFHSPLETVEGIVIKISAPYSDTTVTVEVNPFIQEYKEKVEGGSLRLSQIIVTTPTDQTKKMLFNLNGTKKHKFNIEGKDYEIDLINIGKEEFKNQKFLFYEFTVSNV